MHRRANGNYKKRQSSLYALSTCRHSGVSCKEEEVESSVFDRYRDPLYKEASYKPYIIAAMMVLSKFKNPVEVFEKLMAEEPKRFRG